MYVPPFASSELPLHELGEVRGGDVGVRVSLAEEKGEFVGVEFVEGDEVGLVERFNAGFVGRERLFPQVNIGAFEFHLCARAANLGVSVSVKLFSLFFLTVFGLLFDG